MTKESRIAVARSMASDLEYQLKELYPNDLEMVERLMRKINNLITGAMPDEPVINVCPGS